jgi:hypothetical protein
MQSAGWLAWLLLDKVMLVDPNFRRRLADFIGRQFRDPDKRAENNSRVEIAM